MRLSVVFRPELAWLINYLHFVGIPSPSFGIEYCYEEVLSQPDFLLLCDLNSFLRAHINLPLSHIQWLFKDMAGCGFCCANLYWITLLPSDVLIWAFIEGNCFILLKLFLLHLFCSLSQKCQLVYIGSPLFFFYIQYFVYNLFYVFVFSHFILGEIAKPAILYITVFSPIYSFSVIFIFYYF